MRNAPPSWVWANRWGYLQRNQKAAFRDRKQHNCTLPPLIDGVCVQLAYLNGSDGSPVLGATMSGAAAPDAEHQRFMGGLRDGPELIHQRARLCPLGYPMALEK